MKENLLGYPILSIKGFINLKFSIAPIRISKRVNEGVKLLDFEEFVKC